MRIIPLACLTLAAVLATPARALDLNSFHA